MGANYNDTDVWLEGSNGDDRVRISGFSGSYCGGASNDVMLFTTSHVNPDLFAIRLNVFGGTGADVFDFGFSQSGTVADFKVEHDRTDISAFVGKDVISWSQLRAMISDGAHLEVKTTTHHGFDMQFTGVLDEDLTTENFILYE